MSDHVRTNELVCHNNELNGFYEREVERPSENSSKTIEPST